MSSNFPFYMQIVSAILFIILVFMYFIGYWEASRFVQILFFFAMISSVFSVGIETGKKIKSKG